MDQIGGMISRLVFQLIYILSIVLATHHFDGSGIWITCMAIEDPLLRNTEFTISDLSVLLKTMQSLP